MRLYLEKTLSKKRIVIEVDKLGTKYNNLPDNYSQTAGLYSVLGNITVGLFCIINDLYILWDGEILCADRCQNFEYCSEAKHREIKFTYQNKKFDVQYDVTIGPVATQFYSESEEDVDFGLWLYMILTNAEKRKHISQHWWMYFQAQDKKIEYDPK